MSLSQLVLQCCTKGALSIKFDLIELEVAYVNLRLTLSIKVESFSRSHEAQQGACQTQTPPTAEAAWPPVGPLPPPAGSGR